MTTHTVHLDLGRVLSAPTGCPGCGGGGLRAAGDRDRAAFLCPSCGRRWRFDLGWASVVDPTTSTDCAHREECVAEDVM